MSDIKINRINSEIQRQLSVIISNLKDPGISETLINCTSVKTTKDLKFAKIYLSVIGEDEDKKKLVVKLLTEAKAFIRNQLKELLNIRNIPDLIFQLDTSALYGNKIDNILKSISKGNDDK